MHSLMQAFYFSLFVLWCENTWVFSNVNTGDLLMGLDELPLHNSCHIRTEQKTGIRINAHPITEVKKAAG